MVHKGYMSLQNGTMSYAHQGWEGQKGAKYQEKVGPGKEEPFIAQLSHSPATARQPIAETMSLQGAHKTKNTGQRKGEDKEHTSRCFAL